MTALWGITVLGSSVASIPEAPTAADTVADADFELPSPIDLPTGACVGEYIIIRKLGEGGMGSVYGARHALLDREAAIKVMRQRAEDPEAVQQFIQEARAVNEIGHVNIVDIFAFGTLPDGRPFFVMEWLRGESLAARLRNRGVSLKESCAILVQLCDALREAHAKGIVHRDLKPDNVFLVPTAPGRFLVKLLDFGIAKTRGRARSGSAPRFVGTPNYVAPEQARGRETDSRADVYSLGVMAFEMITGKPPFVADTTIGVIAMHLETVPPLVSSRSRATPAVIDGLIARMLAKDPSERPLLDEVSRACSAFAGPRDALVPHAAPPRPRPSAAVGAHERPRLLPSLLLVLLGACLAGPVGYSVGNRPARPRLAEVRSHRPDGPRDREQPHQRTPVPAQARIAAKVEPAAVPGSARHSSKLSRAVRKPEPIASAAVVRSTHEDEPPAPNLDALVDPFPAGSNK